MVERATTGPSEPFDTYTVRKLQSHSVIRESGYWKYDIRPTQQEARKNLKLPLTCAPSVSQVSVPPATPGNTLQLTITVYKARTTVTDHAITFPYHHA